MDTAETVTTETLKSIADAFNRHDLDGIMAFFTEDAVLETPKGPDPWGRRFAGTEQVREGLAARFAGIPDVHYGDDSHWVSGDRGVSEWTLTGTTTDGEHLRVRGCDLWTFRDGQSGHARTRTGRSSTHRPIVPTGGARKLSQPIGGRSTPRPDCDPSECFRLKLLASISATTPRSIEAREPATRPPRLELLARRSGRGGRSSRWRCSLLHRSPLIKLLMAVPAPRMLPRKREKHRNCAHHLDIRTGDGHAAPSRDAGGCLTDNLLLQPLARRPVRHRGVCRPRLDPRQHQQDDRGSNHRRAAERAAERTKIIAVMVPRGGSSGLSPRRPPRRTEP